MQQSLWKSAFITLLEKPHFIPCPDHQFGLAIYLLIKRAEILSLRKSKTWSIRNCYQGHQAFHESPKTSTHNQSL